MIEIAPLIRDKLPRIYEAVTLIMAQVPSDEIGLDKMLDATLTLPTRIAMWDRDDDFVMLAMVIDDIIPMRPDIHGFYFDFFRSREALGVIDNDPALGAYLAAASAYANIKTAIKNNTRGPYIDMWKDDLAVVLYALAKSEAHATIDETWARTRIEAVIK